MMIATGISTKCHGLKGSHRARGFSTMPVSPGSAGRAVAAVIEGAGGAVVENDGPHALEPGRQIEGEPDAHGEAGDREAAAHRRVPAQAREAVGRSAASRLFVELAGERLRLRDRARDAAPGEIGRVGDQAAGGEPVAVPHDPVAQAPPRVEHQHAGTAAPRGREVALVSSH